MKTTNINVKGNKMGSSTNAFTLKYKELEIGKLTENNGKWTFVYSKEFINQDNIKPLVGFPDKKMQYSSNELWPFFDSRIPSFKNTCAIPAVLADRLDRNNKVVLLSKFGKRTITNPFILVPVINGSGKTQKK